MTDDFIFIKEALEGVDGKVVPLTFYTNGARQVIGEATLRVDDKGLSVDAMSVKTDLFVVDKSGDGLSLIEAPPEESS